MSKLRLDESKKSHWVRRGLMPKFQWLVSYCS